MMLVAAAMGAFLISGGAGALSPSAVAPTADKGTLVDAHLMDDPFGAWVRAAKSPDAGAETPLPGVTGTSLPGPIKSPEAFQALVKGSDVCLLPVIVRGDFHSIEAREMRIRFRAAVVSGLGAAGLIPDDPEHLLMISPPQAWSGEPGRKPPAIDQPMPAEWFVAGGLPRQRSSPYGVVLVVWVQDETLLINPLRALDSLKGALTAQLHESYGVDTGTIDFKVIGPYWSSTLADILAETRAGRDDGKARAGTGTTFYSATATMADGLLDLFSGAEAGDRPAQEGAGDPEPAAAPEGRRRLADPGNGPVLVNLTCTDEELAEALLNELKLRGVDLSDDSTRIAVVSDWDSEYGRVLPLTLASKLAQAKEPKYASVNRADADLLPKLPAAAYAKHKFDRDGTWPRQVLRAYYISGVGGTEEAADAGDKESDSGKSGADGTDLRPLKRAVGEHQVDYIARLGMVFANRLTERDAPRTAGEKPATPGRPPKLRAIGLLGSSVYDELLLLQVLRPRFPEAVFFTDKLDARFFDPAAVGYTRNLVVASSYGFELFQKLQIGAAPFRSSEQTGVFLAVQAAASSRAPDVDFLRSQLLPLRFEIGRTRPVPLFVPGQKQEPANTDNGKFRSRLHPKFEVALQSGGPFWKAHVYDVLFVALGAVFFAAMNMFVFLGRFSLEPSEKSDVLAGALIAGTVVAIVVLFTAIYDGVEPLTWIEGVSTWPSEFFRLVALMTAAGGLYYCGSRVRRSRKILCEEFGLIEAPAVLPLPSGLFAAVGEVLTRMPLSRDDYLLTEAEDHAAAQALHRKGSDYRHAVAAAAAERKREAAKGQTRAPLYVSSQVLWRYLCERSTPARRNARAGLMTAFYFAGWAGLFRFIGLPSSPTRGTLNLVCDGFLLYGGLVAMVYLIFWVVDETQSCMRFVSRLGDDTPSLWPESALEKITSINRIADSRTAAGRKAASAYVDVLFIGRLTAEAVPLIILPFVVLTLLIFARWTFFANWHMTPEVLAFYAAAAGMCVLCALLLKNTATKAKLRAIHNIGLNAADARSAGADGFADSLDALKADMEDNEEGAFMPWSQQPFVRAILLPFGGSGILQAIEFMMSKR